MPSLLDQEPFEEKTHSGVFHIHIDALCALEDKMPFFEYAQKRWGFEVTSFTGHPAGQGHITPSPILTLKLYDQKEFYAIWDELIEQCKKNDFVGYLEGEKIETDKKITNKKYQDTVVIPFKIISRHLKGPPTEEFKQIEYHLTMDAEKSDQRLIKKLIKTGLSVAFMQKKDYKAIIFTAQGFKDTIVPLITTLEKYIEETGGVVRGTIKKEWMIKHHLFNIDQISLPKIVGSIKSPSKS